MGRKKGKGTGRRVQALPGGLAPIDRGMVQRAFEGAKQSRRTENWFTSLGGPNTDIKQAWRWLVSRHQDLIDNEPYAAKAVRELVKGWVGDGVMGTPVGGLGGYGQSGRSGATATCATSTGGRIFMGCRCRRRGVWWHGGVC